ncbi:phytanoyl-CoA dioxygenase [Paenibacillaceae bacterium]|nr:phytanoyl-CoA dioxygenase [Paenibacillaceae bacterium]
MMTYTLDIPSLVKQFEEEGYLLIKNALSDAKVSELNTVIDRIVAEEADSLSYNVYNSVEKDASILSLIDHAELLPLIVNLMGSNIQLHISHLTVRKPNPDGVPTETNSFINWHQDGPAPQFPKIGGLAATYYIKICYILSDMSEPNRGNTKIIPGSHRTPHYRPVQHDVDVPLEGEMQVCGKPGDVFIFPQNLWHAGSPNRTAGFERRQLFIGYSPLWMRPIDYHAASPALLEGADPVRRQLLGHISANCFNYYVPEPAMLPLSRFRLDNTVSVDG